MYLHSSMILSTRIEKKKMVTQKTEIFEIFLYYHEIKISNIFPMKIGISK